MAGQVVARTSFFGGAASIMDVFGVLNSCDRLDPNVHARYEVEAHLLVASYWVDRAMAKYETATAAERRPARAVR